LKEPNVLDPKDTISPKLQLEYINRYLCNESDIKSRQWEILSRLASYVIDETLSPTADQRKQNLKRAAFMEMNKRGGDSKLNSEIFREYCKHYAPFIRKQVEILNPDVIVILGSLNDIDIHILPEDFQNKIIPHWHPAYAWQIRQTEEITDGFDDNTTIGIKRYMSKFKKRYFKIQHS
jgi:hypothetical protein